MIQYVAGLMFSPDLDHVVLIEKQKPDWQKGKYNAIGGKIEKGETPIRAMVREFEEEAFIRTKTSDWKSICAFGTKDYQVTFFYCTNKNWRSCSSRTEEQVFLLPVNDVHTIRNKMIDNLNWLIPMCVDIATRYSGEIRTTGISLAPYF